MELADLIAMEVPAGALKHTIKSHGLQDGTKLSATEDMAKLLSDKSPEIGVSLASEFQFAGSTAVNVHVARKGIDPRWHSRAFFTSYLVEKYGKDILGSGIRPELTSMPSLIRVAKLDERLVLAFSFLGAARRYFDNYEVVVRRPQILEYVVVHFAPFALEIRSSQTQNDMFKKVVLELMDIDSDDVVWDRLTKLTNLEAVQLAGKLGARLRAAKHKMTEGIYATKEVTANPTIQDLEKHPEYNQEFGNQPMKKKTLAFNYTYSFGYEEEVSYVITDEGLWFRTHVGEEVIMHVLNAILDIKYSEDVSGASDDVEQLPNPTKVEMLDPL